MLNFLFCSGKMSSALVPHSPAVEEGVEVNIEANLLSLNSSTLDKRDQDDVTEDADLSPLAKENILCNDVAQNIHPLDK